MSEGEAGLSGEARWGRGSRPQRRVRRRSGRASDRVTVPLRPGNAGGGKGPDFWRAFDGGEDEVIGGEPANTRTDPDPPAKAVSQGEGGAGLPLLPALRQDPSRGHPESRLRARPLQRGRAGGGRGHVRADRGGRAGGVAGRPARRPRREDVPARGGAAGGGPQAGRGGGGAPPPDHSG